MNAKHTKQQILKRVRLTTFWKPSKQVAKPLQSWKTNMHMVCMAQKI